MTKVCNFQYLGVSSNFLKFSWAPWSTERPTMAGTSARFRLFEELSNKLASAEIEVTWIVSTAEIWIHWILKRGYPGAPGYLQMPIFPVTCSLLVDLGTMISGNTWWYTAKRWYLCWWVASLPYWRWLVVTVHILFHHHRCKHFHEWLLNDKGRQVLVV